MDSSKVYSEFISNRLSGSGEITYSTIVGKYIIYHRGKIVVVYMMTDHLKDLLSLLFHLCRTPFMNCHMNEQKSSMQPKVYI